MDVEREWGEAKKYFLETTDIIYKTFSKGKKQTEKT